MIAIPGRVPWPLHRIATSGYYQDSLHTITSQWSLADVVDASDICDALDDARAKASKEK